MAAFTVRQGQRYQAKLVLSGIEAWASNSMIEGRLRAAGFSEIRVSGDGASRLVEAVWGGPDATAEMPKQVTEIVEI